MMSEWVLIIAMFSPGGEFMDKRTVDFKTQADCQAVAGQLGRLDNAQRVKHRGLCVTRDHWTGKKQMKGVAYD